MSRQMEHQQTNLSAEQIEADVVVVGVYLSGDKTVDMTTASRQLDDASGGAISRLIAEGDIRGERRETTAILAPSGIKSPRVVVVGLGKRDALSQQSVRESAGAAIRCLIARPRKAIAMLLDETWPTELQAAAVTGAIVASEGQDLYRAKRSTETPARLLWPQSWSAGIEQGTGLGESVNLARRWVNEPPEVLYPETFAQAAEAASKAANVEIEIWDEKKLAAEKCNALLAVGRGSSRPSRLAILRHQGAGADAPTLGLVGKGVTFDSGGLSLKTSDGMKNMKCDMAGAAVVIATLHAIGRLKLPVNVVGVAGMVENMPSRDAFKLGDVFTARNGTTIEILNTDAEGRLVLADALNVACNEGGATKLIDLATLTGACVVALGQNIAGLMTNDQSWCDTVKAASEVAGEPTWQLPMSAEFGEQIKSKIADIKNIGSGRWGGAMTAAKLLENFVEERPWVHMDIAGPAYSENPKVWTDAGATGAMVQTLVEVARGWTG